MQPKAHTYGLSPSTTPLPNLISHAVDIHLHPPSLPKFAPLVRPRTPCAAILVAFDRSLPKVPSCFSPRFESKHCLAAGRPTAENTPTIPAFLNAPACASQSTIYCARTCIPDAPQPACPFSSSHHNPAGNDSHALPQNCLLFWASCQHSGRGLPTRAPPCYRWNLKPLCALPPSLSFVRRALYL